MDTPATNHVVDSVARLGRDAMPVQWGGRGFAMLRMMDQMEAAGYRESDAGRSFSLVTTVASTGVALADFGEEQQQRKWIPGVVDGTVIGAHAITEAVSGSDALSMATRARPEGDGYILDGTKSFVTNAGIADVYVIYARTSAKPSPLGLTAFLVPAATSGLKVTEVLQTAGLESAPVGELELIKCRVGTEAVLGGIGRGFLVLDHVMKREILFSFMVNVGEMRRRLDEVVAWARRRHQYGQAIGRYQSVANRVVDMRIAMETSRLLLRHAATMVDSGQSATAEIAMAKLVTSEANLASAVSATKVLGGRGYLRDSGLEQCVRDALGGAIYSGTNDIQYNRIASEMGLR